MIIPIIGFALEHLDRENYFGSSPRAQARRRAARASRRDAGGAADFPRGGGASRPVFYCSLGLFLDTIQYKLPLSRGGRVSSSDLSLGCTAACQPPISIQFAKVLRKIRVIYCRRQPCHYRVI
jgi:hypothetical protein